ncbi:MAG: hypothetical protein AVDCRST_MAG85-195, partial [uncultured Solirubrobacteraceae bacterium]
ARRVAHPGDRRHARAAVAHRRRPVAPRPLVAEGRAHRGRPARRVHRGHADEEGPRDPRGLPHRRGRAPAAVRVDAGRRGDAVRALPVAQRGRRRPRDRGRRHPRHADRPAEAPRPVARRRRLHAQARDAQAARRGARRAGGARM